jgi:hypothetical protein
MERKEMIWVYLIDYNIATEEELKLVTCINGYNEDVLNDVIYAKTGYNSIEQLQNEDNTEE